MTTTIIVHGGAWNIPQALQSAHVAGCRAAAEAGWAVLAGGGSALAAVEAAIRIMEDDPVFDAGRGSHLNRDGEVELDAGIMDGRTLDAGAVAAVRRIANPIILARHVMTGSQHVLLVGSGAERFAQEIGTSLCDPAYLVVERERTAWEQRCASEGLPGAEFWPNGGDTVGAVAVDGEGNLAAGNSTGGTSFKLPGRVGDTPIIGSGLYADNQMGAAACTGWGEQIMKTMLAKAAVDHIAWLSDPAAAAKVAIAYFEHRIGGLGGVICAAPDGRVGWAHSTPCMPHAYRTAGMAAVLADLGSKQYSSSAMNGNRS
jgi:L-asparaginase / beta-aspartyl-peptidase